MELPERPPHQKVLAVGSQAEVEKFTQRFDSSFL